MLGLPSVALIADNVKLGRRFLVVKNVCFFGLTSCDEAQWNLIKMPTVVSTCAQIVGLHFSYISGKMQAESIFQYTGSFMHE